MHSHFLPADTPDILIHLQCQHRGGNSHSLHLRWFYPFCEITKLSQVTASNLDKETARTRNPRNPLSNNPTCCQLVCQLQVKNPSHCFSNMWEHVNKCNVNKCYCFCCLENGGLYFLVLEEYLAGYNVNIRSISLWQIWEIPMIPVSYNNQMH